MLLDFLIILLDLLLLLRCLLLVPLSVLLQLNRGLSELPPQVFNIFCVHGESTRLSLPLTLEHFVDFISGVFNVGLSLLL